MDLSQGSTIAVSAGWALANCAEPAVAALLLTRAGRAAPDLSRRQDLLRFGLYGATAGPLAGATIGATVGLLFAGEPWYPRMPRWLVGERSAWSWWPPRRSCGEAAPGGAPCAAVPGRSPRSPSSPA